MIKKITLVLAILATLLFLAIYLFTKSGHSRLQINTSEVKKSVQIKHFDDAFYPTKPAELTQQLPALKKEFSPFFVSNTNPNFWQQQLADKNQQLLYADWKKRAPTYKKLDAQLSDAFTHLYYYYPKLPEFTAYTYVSNLDFDYPILLAEDFIFIGVDNYLGKNHPAYANQNQYQNYFRQPEFIVSDAALQFAQNFALKNLDDQTLLNEMIWWGKKMYFAHALQPGAADTIVTRMSQKKLDFCTENEQNIWLFFINNQLLYNTTAAVKRKFIDPAPFSKFGMPFDRETPGMIGRWLGYRIVRSYMQNNPSVSLQQLMQSTDYQQLFKLSKYKP